MKFPREFFVFDYGSGALEVYESDVATAHEGALASYHVISAERVLELQAQCEKLAATLEYVKQCDAYPDLSAFKFRDGFNLIRPKIREALEEYRAFKKGGVKGDNEEWEKK